MNRFPAGPSCHLRPLALDRCLRVVANAGVRARPRNLRRMRDRFALDGAGFTHLNLATAVADFFDAEDVDRTYQRQ